MEVTCEKVQILFTEPTLRKLKDISREEDRSVSEVVRRATELWLASFPDALGKRKKKVAVTSL